jgi:hypothetical protein
VQQQHEKRRKKRDYSEPNFPAFGDYPAIFGSGLQDQQHQPQYRGIGPHNVFPDPLFKEQWYLVSTVVIIIIIVIVISMPSENIPPDQFVTYLNTVVPSSWPTGFHSSFKSRHDDWLP